MSWQRRLADLAVAGGLVTIGCLGLGGPPCGNANPDPCICGNTPDNSPACFAKTYCGEHNGLWDYDGMTETSAGYVPGHCIYGWYDLDAGVDAVEAPATWPPPNATGF